MLLIEAIKKERISQICYFLKVDFDVNLQDEYGQTALIHCCFVKHARKRLYILKLLLSTDEVDVNCRDKYGRSALSWICTLGLIDLFSTIIDDYNGQVDLRTQDNEGNTLLMLAVLSTSTSMVECLLKTLSNCGLLYQVNSVNKKGISPLLVAFRRRDKECADLLMCQGCAVVSSVLKNLYKHPTSTDLSQRLPARGQAYHTKLRSIQRHDDGYNSKLPSEEEFLQFLYSTPKATKDADHNLANNFADIIALRPARPVHITQGFFCSNVAMVTKAFRPSRLDTQKSFENLYSIYSTQLSCSYRQSTIQIPSPPPSEETIVTLPRRRSLLHRSSNLSQSSSKTSPSKRSSAGSSIVLTPYRNLRKTNTCA